MPEVKITRRNHGLKDQAIETGAKEDVIRLSVDIPKSLHKKLKIRAIEEDNSTIGAIVIEAVIAYLETNIKND